jgi:hypothetical protein
MDRGFVVYAHFVDGEPDPFYIGEGRPKRARDRSNRNRYWRFKVEKHGGFRHEIVASGMSKSEAESMERALIREHRARGTRLTNICAGPMFDRGGRAGRPKHEHPMFGRRFSAPWIAESNRRRSGLKLKPRPDLAERNRAGGLRHYTRAVVCVETGVEFPSIVLASEFAGVHDSKIHRALKEGGRSGGYRWRYVNTMR